MSDYLLECHDSKLMIEIEAFVKKTLQRRRAWSGFWDELDDLVYAMDEVYTPALTYSAYIQAFIALIDEVKVRDRIDEQKLDKLGYRDIQDIFVQFERLAQRELRSFTASELRNQERLLQYIKQLIHHYSKLLFVRVDLAYLKEKQSEIDIRTFKDDVRQLIGFVQDGDTCFADIEGYAWALEQGEEKGYHCHLLLIYNGSACQKDYYYADQVIKKWKRITESDGYGFNCNTTEHKEKFSKYNKLGVGMIHRHQAQKVQNALNTSSYLVNPEKTNQYLRVKPKNMRTFGTGSYVRAYRRYKSVDGR